MLVVGSDVAGEGQTGIKTQVPDGDKRSVLGLTSEIQAAYDTSLVTGVADPGDGAAGRGLARSILRGESRSSSGVARAGSGRARCSF
jgi:hypothetical protein